MACASIFVHALRASPSSSVTIKVKSPFRILGASRDRGFNRATYRGTEPRGQCRVATSGAVVAGRPDDRPEAQGRTQNEKHRALVPVLPTLDRWLRVEYATSMNLKPTARTGRGWLVNYHRRPVQDADRVWDTMLTRLEMPKGREWRSYLLQHSLDARSKPRRHEMGSRRLHGPQR